jgi:hypothetical protein
MLYTYSQSSNEMGILVYFKEGVSTESSVVARQKILKAKINKVSLRKSFENMDISEDSLNGALPNFNQLDTLRILEDGRKVKQLDMSKLYKIKLRKGLDIYKTIDQLKSLPEVLYAEPDGIVKPEYQPNDPKYQYQWNLEDSFRPDAGIHMEKAWDIYKGNVNNIIAVIDGGVDVTHEDLKDKIVGVNVGVGLGYWANHGTEVAGIAAAESNNNLGIAGVDLNARILSKRMDLGGVAAVYQAIVDAVNFSPNVSVLNNSYSIYNNDGTTLSTESLTVREAIAYAYKNNRVFVSVMGNEQLTQPNVTAYPGGCEHVIAVGETNSDAYIDPHSGVGSHNDVCAPGVNVLTTFSGNNYFYDMGTSFAAPHVSGIASLLKGYNLNLANDDIEYIIKLSADKIPAMNGDNFNPTYGYGRVNAERALKYLLPPYTLVQQSAISGTTVNTSAQKVFQFFTAGNLSSGNYIVQKIEVQKAVALPDSIYNIIGVWGRGAFSIGWSPEVTNYGEGFCDVVPGSLTSTNVTLRTYVYDVSTLLGVHLGYYPASPANATFAYSILGLKKPTITGPSQICNQGTYMINNLAIGDVVTWSATPANIVSFQPNGNSVTLTKVGNGKITLTATINSNLTISMPVSVGAPYYLGISGISNLNMWDVGYFQVLPGTGYYAYEGTLSVSDGVGLATSYGWSLVSRSTGGSISWWPSGGSVDVAMKQSNSDLTLKCTATNSCGSYTQYYWFSTGAFIPLILTPNPSSTQVEVSIGDEATSNAGTLQPVTTEIADNISYSISVVDIYGNTVYSTTKTGKKFTISTSSFRNGIYAVIVSDGKTVYQKKLIVNH